MQGYGDRPSGIVSLTLKWRTEGRLSTCYALWIGDWTISVYASPVRWSPLSSTRSRIHAQCLVHPHIDQRPGVARTNRGGAGVSRAPVIHYVIDGPNHCFPSSESEKPIVFSPILRARGYNGRTSHLPSPPSLLCAIQSSRLVPSSPPFSF